MKRIIVCSTYCMTVLLKDYFKETRDNPETLILTKFGPAKQEFECDRCKDAIQENRTLIAITIQVPNDTIVFDKDWHKKYIKEIAYDSQ